MQSFLQPDRDAADMWYKTTHAFAFFLCQQSTRFPDARCYEAAAHAVAVLQETDRRGRQMAPVFAAMPEQDLFHIADLADRLLDDQL